MTLPEITRRASYGPTSPVVGERGARTRQEIVDATLALFAEHGFHGTAVDDIARRAGISRATLYQYFESKEHIFVELVEEGGSALMRVVRTVGPFAPTPEGFANLHSWLGEWAAVYGRYQTMFIEWGNVNSPGAPIRSLISRFVDAHTSRLAEHLGRAGVAGVDVTAMALLLQSLAERYNYLLHRYRDQLATPGEEALLDTLAIAVQLALFPQTPSSALAARVGPSETGAATGPASQPGRPGRPVLPANGANGANGSHRLSDSSLDGARTPGTTRSDRIAGLGPRAAETVRQLIDAGGRVFAAVGYQASTVDQIVAEAGLSRGTFYKYFDDRLDLLLTLAEEAGRALAPIADTFAEITIGPSMPEELRSWVGSFFAVHARYAGVFRVWVEGVPRLPELYRPSQRIGRHLIDASTRVLAQVPRSHHLHPEAAALVLLAVLERFPDDTIGTRYQLSTSQAIETASVFIERALLGANR